MDKLLERLRGQLSELIYRHGGVLRLRGRDKAIAEQVQVFRQRTPMKRSEMAEALGVSRNQLDYLLSSSKGPPVDFKEVKVSDTPCSLELILPSGIRVSCRDMDTAVAFSWHWS